MREIAGVMIFLSFGLVSVSSREMIYSEKSSSVSTNPGESEARQTAFLVLLRQQSWDQVV
jgi:hypothetical protein